MTPAELYLSALATFTGVVDTVPPERWDAPSPCPDWTARQLLGHVIDAQRQVRSMLDGATVAPAASLGGITGDDPPGAWAAARAATEDAVRSADPDAVVATPGGPAPVAALLGTAVIEPLVHAWDLAAAGGRSVTLDPQVVAAVLPAVLAAADGLAASGMYRPPVPQPPTASAQDTLLGALGRAPTAQPPSSSPTSTTRSVPGTGSGSPRPAEETSR